MCIIDIKEPFFLNKIYQFELKGGVNVDVYLLLSTFIFLSLKTIKHSLLSFSQLFVIKLILWKNIYLMQHLS